MMIKFMLYLLAAILLLLAIVAMLAILYWIPTGILVDGWITSAIVLAICGLALGLFVVVSRFGCE